MSRIGMFGAFRERLQIEHCRPECHHDVTQCPIAKALSHNYADFKWCPLCNGYKIGEQEITIGKGEFAKKITRWLLGGSGGLIRGFLPDGFYKAVFACKCGVGRHTRIDGKRIKEYDFEADPESRDDCFQKRRLDMIKIEGLRVKKRIK